MSDFDVIVIKIKQYNDANKCNRSPFRVTYGNMSILPFKTNFVESEYSPVQIYNDFVKILIRNYTIGSLFAVCGIGGIFLFFTLTLTVVDIAYLTFVLILSLTVMFTAEFHVFKKHLKSIRVLFEESNPTVEELQKGFVSAHQLPMKSARRIMGPHLLGLLIPGITMTSILITYDLISIPVQFVYFSTAGAILVAGMHASIEFFLTGKAIHIVTNFIEQKGKELYNASLSLNGQVLISLRKKFLFSTLFIGISPLLLFNLATQVRLEQSTDLVISNYWAWAIVILIIEIAFAMFGALLLYRDIEQPIIQLQQDMKSVQEGHLTYTKDLYSDDFSKLISGFNHMVQAIDERDQQNNKLSESLISTLAAALDAKDPYTAGHSMRVAQFSVEIGKRAGLSEVQLNHLRKSALLHDIGKIGISDFILLKNGKLTEEEFEQIKKHPVLGHDILSRVNPIDEMLPLLDGVKYHHERYDGKGYPEGKTGENIPLFGRIMAVADAYDAMTSDRPYRRGMTAEKAISIIQSGRGTQWDPYFAELFIEYIEEQHETKQTKKRPPLK